MKKLRNSFSLNRRKPPNPDCNAHDTSQQQQNLSEPHELQEGGEMELQGSEEVLVRIPEAVVHLVDEEANIEVGRGEFCLIRLLQGSTGLAIFAKVGEELRWPVTKDEPTVKVDSCHYLFSIRPPTSEEESGDSAEFGGSEILNYGVTFEGGEGLELLDKLLEQHACVNFPHGGGKSVKEREGCEAAYWADFAPKVQDYNSMLAKAIASGSGQIIKGLFRCSNGYTSQVQKGGEYVRNRTKAKSNKPNLDGRAKNSEISPRIKRNIKRVKKLSKMTRKMSKNVLKGVITTTGAVTGPVVTSKAGKKFFTMLPGEVLLASLDAINKVMEAVERAGEDCLSATSGVTSGIVTHKYGEAAGEVTQDVFEVAWNALGTAINVVMIRKAIDPATNGNISSSVVKNSFKAIAKGVK